MISRIVDTIGAMPGETLLEIGAGSGQLTVPILATGAHVLALETDARLAAKLPKCDRLEVLRTDAATADFSELLRGHELDAVRVYGNLPYSVAAPILLGLLSAARHLQSLTLMFQNEVANRLVAPPGSKEYSFLSVVAQQAARVDVLFRVPAAAFKPRPRVTSAVVGFDLRSEPFDVGNEQTFRDVVRALLAHRRKTIANNVRYLAQPRLTAERLASALAETGVDTTRRAETLSVEEFAEISRICALSG